MFVEGVIGPSPRREKAHSAVGLAGIDSGSGKLGRLLASAVPTQPFVCDIAHRCWSTALDPGHERTVELKAITAFGGQELADLLGVTVLIVQRSGTIEGA